MPYAIFENSYKTLSSEQQMIVFNLVLSLCKMNQNLEEKKKQVEVDEITEKLNAVYSKIPKSEQLEYCDATLENFRELTKNDSW